MRFRLSPFFSSDKYLQFARLVVVFWFLLFSVSFVRFLGKNMGCDGGTIPKRCELVREKKKPEKVDKEIELNAKWFHCAISQEELREPIVSCQLGNLYRKEAVLEYLLDTSKTTTDVARHIRGLKDVKELKLTKKNNKADAKVGGRAADAYLDFQASEFICPIAGLEMNGRYRFCFSWKCGCVFSERGLKEVPSTTCHNCGTPFGEEDIVVINGSEDDVTRLREKMENRRLKAKEEKKAKKSRRAAVANGDEMAKDAKRAKGNSADVQNGTFVSTSVQSKIKDGKLKSSFSTTSKTKSSSSASGSDDSLAYTKYKSVAENPEASKVFKSLFSSSHKEKPKHLQSNWVTYHSYHC